MDDESFAAFGVLGWIERGFVRLPHHLEVAAGLQNTLRGLLNADIKATVFEINCSFL